MRQVEVRRPVTVVPAGNTNYDVSLPAGFYHLAILVKSNVTGATTTVGVRPYVDQAGTQIGANFRSVTPGSTATTLLAIAAGASGTSALLLNNGGSGTTAASPCYCAGKLRIDVVKGGAVAGETLEILLIAHRVA